MNQLELYGLTDRFANEAGLYPDLRLARVITQYKGQYKIVTAAGEYKAEISGKLRHETEELAKYPAVGDFVMVSGIPADANDDSVDIASVGTENSGQIAIIHRILTRKSVFLRTAVGVRGQAQPVASNIDYVFICMGLDGNYNLNRLERYIAVAWDSGAIPVIILTKSDLCPNLAATLIEVEQVSAYSDTITISMYDGDAAEKLAPYLKPGITSAFIGSSGVGKSTLINNLLGTESLLTGATGKACKGRHTTTGREMYPSPLGGVLIDTPGMRELGAESVDLETTFEDIEALAAQCKFSDCTHTGEPGCAVQAALEDGSLDLRRFESYLKLKTETDYEGLSSKQIEIKKADRLFSEIGGRKNARRFTSEKRKGR